MAVDSKKARLERESEVSRRWEILWMPPQSVLVMKVLYNHKGRKIRYCSHPISLGQYLTVRLVHSSLYDSASTASHDSVSSGSSSGLSQSSQARLVCSQIDNRSQVSLESLYKSAAEVRCY